MSEAELNGRSEAEEFVLDVEVVVNGLVQLALVPLLVLFHSVALHIAHQQSLIDGATTQH